MHVQLIIDGMVSTVKTAAPFFTAGAVALTAANAALSVVINVPKAKESFPGFTKIVWDTFGRPKRIVSNYSPLILSSISLVDTEINPDFEPDPSPTPHGGGASSRPTPRRAPGSALPAYIRKVIDGGRDRTIDNLGDIDLLEWCWSWAVSPGEHDARGEALARRLAAAMRLVVAAAAAARPAHLGRPVVADVAAAAAAANRRHAFGRDLIEPTATTLGRPDVETMRLHVSDADVGSGLRLAGLAHDLGRLVLHAATRFIRDVGNALAVAPNAFGAPPATAC